MENTELGAATARHAPYASVNVLFFRQDGVGGEIFVLSSVGIYVDSGVSVIGCVCRA